jgi:hypothetical protein
MGLYFDTAQLLEKDFRIELMLHAKTLLKNRAS